MPKKPEHKKQSTETKKGGDMKNKHQQRRKWKGGDVTHVINHYTKIYNYLIKNLGVEDALQPDSVFTKTVLTIKKSSDDKEYVLSDLRNEVKELGEQIEILRKNSENADIADIINRFSSFINKSEVLQMLILQIKKAKDQAIFVTGVDTSITGLFNLKEEVPPVPATPATPATPVPVTPVPATPVPVTPASASWGSQFTRSASQNLREGATDLGASVASKLPTTNQVREHWKSAVGNVRSLVDSSNAQGAWNAATNASKAAARATRSATTMATVAAQAMGDNLHKGATTAVNKLGETASKVADATSGLAKEAQQKMEEAKEALSQEVAKVATETAKETGAVLPKSSIPTMAKAITKFQGLRKTGAVPVAPEVPAPEVPAPIEAPAPEVPGASTEASVVPAETHVPTETQVVPEALVASDVTQKAPTGPQVPSSVDKNQGFFGSLIGKVTGKQPDATPLPVYSVPGETCPLLTQPERKMVLDEVDRLVSSGILSRNEMGDISLLVPESEFEEALSQTVKDILTKQSGGKKKDRKLRGGEKQVGQWKLLKSILRCNREETTPSTTTISPLSVMSFPIIIESISPEIKTFIEADTEPVKIASGIPDKYQPHFVAVALLDRKFNKETDAKAKKQALAHMATMLQKIASIANEGTAGGAKKHRKRHQKGGDEGVDSSKMYNTQGLISELSSTFDKAIITNTTMIPKPFSASGYAGYTSSVDVSLPSEYKADYIPDMTNVVSGGGKKRSHRKEGGWPTLNRPMTAPVKGMPHSSLLQRARQAMSPVGKRVASAVVRVRNATSPLGQQVASVGRNIRDFDYRGFARGGVDALGSSLLGGEAGEAEQEGAGRFGDAMRSIGHGIGTGARGFARGVRASAHGVARGVRASAHGIAQGARRVGHAIRSRSPSPMGARPGFLSRLRSRSPSPMGARPGFLSRLRSRSPSPMGAPMGAPGPVRAPLARSPAVSRSPSPVGMGRGLPAQRPAPLSRSASVRSATAPATAPALAGPATPMSLAERAMRFAENNPKTALAIAGLAAQIANGSPQTQNPYGAPVDCNHSFYANYPICVEQRKRMMRPVPPTLIGGKTKNPKTSKALKKK